MVLEEIIIPIKDKIDLFDKKFSECIRPEGFFIDEISSHVFNNKGKKIRPIITLLSAGLIGKINHKTIRTALILELLHTASLIHDDVIDQSEMRRGMNTVNKIWGNHSAILYGDYLYSKCLELIETKADFNLLPIYAKVGRELPIGELLQKQVSDNMDYSLESYYKVISKKTATLMEASSVSGGMSTKADNKQIEILKQFGNFLGMAFQIRDDILDFSHNNTGKPLGNDIREKKITLPLILVLNKLDHVKKNNMLSLIDKEYKTKKEIKEIIDMVIIGGGLEKAQEKVREYSRVASQLLDNFPSSIYKNSLNKLLNYLLEREK